MSPSSSNKRGRMDISVDDKLSIEGPKNLEKLAELWRNGYLCDIAIVVDDETFQAHRLVLAAGSDYMRALLAEDRFEDSTKNSIELPGMKAAQIRFILEWLYGGRCELDDETMAVQVLEAACRLQCVDLISSLEKAIARMLRSETSLTMWKVAERMQLSTLAAAVKEKALTFFDDLTDSAEFKSLPASLLSSMISSDKLCTKKEELVFSSIISWAKAQNDPPSQDTLGELFEQVRFPRMSAEFITSSVETEELLMGNRKGVMSLVCGLKDKAFGIKTKRTSARIGNGITLDDIKPGFKFRIKSDLEEVKDLFADCEDDAEWVPAMSIYLGHEEEFDGRQVYLQESDNVADVHFIVMDECLWPFTVLERV